ncbi:MAG: membrane protein insertion efficiency factor YidD [Candidatus Paceibacterota bacterium]
MNDFFISLLNFYRKWISPHTKPSCVFFPTCSEYSLSAFKKYGPLKGFYLSIRRILRCHPWQKNRVDFLK